MYASGMAAAAAILFTKLSSGDRIVASDVVYPGVAELIRNTLPRFGIEVDTVDTSDLDRVAAALQRPAELVWLESPANPISRGFRAPARRRIRIRPSRPPNGSLAQ